MSGDVTMGHFDAIEGARIACQLRKYADRIDRPGAPKATFARFTFEEHIGMVFRDDGRGCLLWYHGDEDYERAHTEAGPLLGAGKTTLAQRPAPPERRHWHTPGWACDGMCPAGDRYHDEPVRALLSRGTLLAARRGSHGTQSREQVRDVSSRSRVSLADDYLHLRTLDPCVPRPQACGGPDDHDHHRVAVQLPMHVRPA